MSKIKYFKADASVSSIMLFIEAKQKSLAKFREVGYKEVAALKEYEIQNAVNELRSKQDRGF